jgi:F420-dependent oxidoreductase-like protein
MRLALMTEPQLGLSYEEILAAARAAEAAGLEAFFRSDHYLGFPGGADRATTDAWTTLAGLARDTRTIRLGALVSPVTFRIPGSFAKVVATVDEMSDGRIEAGMGAGWNAAEHAAYGIPFPSGHERFERFEEAVEIVHGLWSEPDGWSFPGHTWQVENARFRPSPVRAGHRHPHLILGGEGRPRAVRLAVRLADEYNVSSVGPEAAAATARDLAAACSELGRDRSTIVLSAMVGVLVAENEAGLRDRTRALLAAVRRSGDGDDAAAWLADRRSRWIIGTPDEAAERLADFASAGVERVMLQDFLPRDLEMIGLIGRALVPAAAAFA